jgi:cell pole-organizing protein PopZ
MPLGVGEMKQAGEPSVEEILESIKKVIARDNRAGAAVERKEREERGLRAPPVSDRLSDDDVLELDADAVLVDSDEDRGESEAPLLPEDQTRAMRESLAALAMLAEPGMPPQIVRSGETSLEGLTRELLRPALAEWLDKNLPPLVERMVAAEIARIVGKKV